MPWLSEVLVYLILLWVSQMFLGTLSNLYKCFHYILLEFLTYIFHFSIFLLQNTMYHWKLLVWHNINIFTHFIISFHKNKVLVPPSRIFFTSKNFFWTSRNHKRLWFDNYRGTLLCANNLNRWWKSWEKRKCGSVSALKM